MWHWSTYETLENEANLVMKPPQNLGSKFNLHSSTVNSEMVKLTPKHLLDQIWIFLGLLCEALGEMGYDGKDNVHS